MKCRGKLQLTNEILAKMIGLPEDIEIINVDFNGIRGIVDLTLRSDKEVKGFTFETGEGMEPQHIDYASGKKILAYHNKKQEESQNSSLGI